MNFVKNIISHFHHKKNVPSLSEQNFSNDINVTENVEKDDAELNDLLTSQSSGTFTDLFNITDDIEHPNDANKSADLKNQYEISTDVELESEEALMDLDDIFQNLDGIEKTMEDSNEENACNTNGINITDVMIDDSLSTLKEIEKFCNGIENTEEKVDGTEFNVDKNCQTISDINTQELTTETLFNLDEFDRFCDEIENTEEGSYETEAIAKKSNVTTLHNQLEVTMEEYNTELNEFDVRKMTDNISLETRNIFINDDQTKEINSGTQYTSGESILKLNEIHDVVNNLDSLGSSNINIPFMEFENKTYATLTEVKPVACCSPNIVSVSKAEQDIDTGIVKETAKIANQDVYNLRVQAIIGENETKDNNNIEAPSNHTITQIYPLMEDKNSIVFGVVLESNLKGNNFDKNIVSEVNEDTADVISISSTEDLDKKSSKNVQISKLGVISISGNEGDDSDDCSGYNSSDFELISESEAKVGGIISKNTKKLKAPETNTKSGIDKDQPNTSKDCTNKTIDINIPGPSKTDINKKSQAIFTNNFHNRRILPNREIDYRENHRIPEGEDYLNLFRGIYAPALSSELFLMENKSVRPITCMNMQYDGLGFDMRLHRNQEGSDGENNDDAVENAKKIMSMYPHENRKRRRRF